MRRITLSDCRLRLSDRTVIFFCYRTIEIPNIILAEVYALEKIPSMYIFEILNVKLLNKLLNIKLNVKKSCLSIVNVSQWIKKTVHCTMYISNKYYVSCANLDGWSCCNGS